MKKGRVAEPYEFMKKLKEQGVKFTLRKSLFTMDIESEYGVVNWISPESKLPRGELYFIKMVKDAASRIDLATVEPIDRREIRYFNLDTAVGEWEDCIEIDLNGAYWEFSKWWLPAEIYERGLTVDKRTRLAALGNLAKTTTESYFDGTEYHEDVEVKTEITKDLFFSSAKATGDIMSILKYTCTGSIFYWVDALFVKNEVDMLLALSVIASAGLQAKTYRCEKIIATEKQITIFSLAHKKHKRVFLKERLSSNYFIGRFKDYLYTEKKELK